HPPQAPRQVRDRRGSAQPSGEGHQDRVLARRGAVPRSPQRPRVDREVRQGLPGRLDRAQGLHPARHAGPDPAAVHQLRPVRGRWWGYRTFEATDTATNLTPWAVWIGGDELHNNHHAFPSSAKFSLRKFEFDIGWTTLKLLQAVGLAKVLRVAPTLDVRPNIAMPDGETLRALLAIRFQE